MKKHITIITIIVIIILIAILAYVVIVNSKGEILYSTTYYFEFGSRSTKIYENGDVYDNLEIENPNHNSDYEYLKTLTKDEINDLENKLKDESNSELMQDYVMQLVYGVTEFDDYGNF